MPPGWKAGGIFHLRLAGWMGAGPCKFPSDERLLIYTSAMLKHLLFCLRLAIVFAGIVFFGKAVQYLIFYGGFSGEFFDYVFFRK